MANKRACLYCYEELIEETEEYHKRCCRKLFGTEVAPRVEFGMDEVEAVAEKIVHARLVVTGVQPKLSVELEKPARGTADKPVLRRVTLTGLWGRYILKPPHKKFPLMPEIEDLSMQLAEVCGIKTALHGLVRLKSGELAYIAKRFDRVDSKKLAMEDMCQLTGLLTEDKYHSSTEQIGKAITKYSSNPGIDLTSFLEIVIFSYLIGNSDMHLKNFSLLTDEQGLTGLSPAYDLLAVKLLTPEDNEEMALPINGKKSKLRSGDFIQLGLTLNIPQKAIDNILKKLKNRLSDMPVMIERSFLSDAHKRSLGQLIEERARVLFA